MLGRLPLVLALAAALVGCREATPAPDGESERPPTPSFAPLFPAVPGELMSLSSPALADLDGDGVPDIVFGSGVDRLRPIDGEWGFADDPATPGWVTAVSGATNRVLWKTPHTGEAYSTPRFADLDGDDVPDVLAGGREGAFAAFSGADGSVIWRASPRDIAETPVPYNFSTPALAGDVDGDGVADVVVGYGGDATRVAGEPRDPGYVVVLSGADGSVVAAHATPDGAETYASPVLYSRADGSPWVVFGTGGETDGGAAFRAPLASLLDGTFGERVERLTPTGDKGVMAPVTVVELTGDGDPDLAISTFDGALVVINGASGEVLWERRDADEESYQPAAVVRVGPDTAVGGGLALALSRGVGAFPAYTGSAHRLLDARDGHVLWEYRSTGFPAGAPLAVDLTGDGVDEVFFFADPGRIHVLHLPTRRVVTHAVGTQFSATPLVADPRGTGSLELIGVAWHNGGGQQGGVFDWRALRLGLLRMDLDAPAPASMTWPGYMGAETDGRYRPPGSR